MNKMKLARTGIVVVACLGLYLSAKYVQPKMQQDRNEKDTLSVCDDTEDTEEMNLEQEENIAVALSKSQMQEDYDELCNLLDEHYLCWEEVKDHGIDKDAIYEKYKKKVNDAKSTTEFMNDMADFCMELDAMQYGHFTYIMPAYYEETRELYMKCMPNTPWANAVSNQTTQDMYHSYSGKYIGFVPQDEEDDDKWKEMRRKEEPGESSSQMDMDSSFYEMHTELLEGDTIGYIRIPSFEDYLMEEQVPVIQKFISDHKDLKNIIIDIRGNGGGNEAYWEEAISGPNLTKPVKVKMYYLFKKNLMKDTLTREFIGCLLPEIGTEKKPVSDLTDFTDPCDSIDDYDYYFEKSSSIEPGDEPSGYRGKFWVLTDKGNASAASSFTDFCKQSGFATLIGEAGGGDNCCVDPGLFAMKNSGFVVRFDLFYGLNADGSSNALTGTVPDISCDSEDALNVCLDKIKSEE